MKTRNDIKALAMAFAMLALSTVSCAQETRQSGSRPSREQMIESRANDIAKKLELDEATSQKFLAIYKSEMEEMSALRPKRGEASGASTTIEETKAKMTALKEKYNKQYSEILSQEKIAELNQLREQPRGNRHSGGNR